MEKSLGLNTDEEICLVGTTAIIEAWQNTLYQLPLVSGQVFGTKAQEALKDYLLLSETRAKHMMQQIALRHITPTNTLFPQSWISKTVTVGGKQTWLVCNHRSEGCMLPLSNCCGPQTIPPFPYKHDISDQAPSFWASFSTQGVYEM